MRVAVIQFPSHDDNSLKSAVEAAVKGFTAKGCQVEVLHGYKDTLRLVPYGYVCFIGEGRGLFASSADPKIRQILDQASGLTGKRSCIIFPRKLLFAEKSSISFMSMVESQGVVIRNSLLSSDSASIEWFCRDVDVESIPH